MTTPTVIVGHGVAWVRVYADRPESPERRAGVVAAALSSRALHPKITSHTRRGLEVWVAHGEARAAEDFLERFPTAIWKTAAPLQSHGWLALFASPTRTEPNAS